MRGTFRSEARSGPSPAERRALTKALVVTELALALVLLAGVGLLVKSVRHWRELDAGIRPGNMPTLHLTRLPE